MKIGSRDFQTSGKTYVMGILNLTPDSFSDGGKWVERDKALFHVEEMLREGMDILDIGGESTRPGHTQISDQEELDRVLPVLQAVRTRFDVPISLDTYKSAVAAAGLDAGANLINDIWGLKYDPDMAPLLAKAGAPCCLMHNRKIAQYGDFLADVQSDLRETLSLADRAGIRRENIILDPGVGFAKSDEQNLFIIRRLDALASLGCPLLLGCSRKSVIGHTLGLPTGERLEGTLVTTVLAVLHDCMFVRVHDIKENVRAVRMAEAILR